MTRFIAGVLCTVLVYLLGWDTITTALSRANQAAQSAYQAAETQAARVKDGAK
jgi:hypothetical protein